MTSPASELDAERGRSPRSRISWPGLRPCAVALLALLFVVAYPHLFRLLGPDLAAIFVMGVMPASLAYGLIGGILAGAVALPANMVLLSRIGPDALQALSSDWAGAATGLCIGIAAGAGRDLFERQRTRALEREIAHLTRAERDLARANHDLERARGAAERAVRAKSVLLGRVSHELRTPVAAILGYVEMMREEMQAGGLTSPERDLGRIHGAARHLAVLLDDLLDVTRLESGRFTPKLARVPVRELLADVWTIAMPLAARRGNLLTVEQSDDALQVVTDRCRAEQILLNLVANAAKYTDHGRIAVRAAPATRDGADVLQLTVSDTGIGMTPEQAERAFEEFYQAAPSSTPGGTGLGLAITRQFCEHLGGTIALESAPGRGTTVTVLLPVEARAALAAASAA